MGYKEKYKEAQKSKRTEVLTPRYVTFEKEGDNVIGRLMGVQHVDSKLGGEGYNQYLMDTDEGLIKFALGRATDGEVAPLFYNGGVYCVTFKGVENISGGRRVNKYTIERILEEDEAPVMPPDKKE